MFVNQEAEREQEKTKKLKNANELFEEQIMQHVSTSVAIQPRKKKHTDTLLAIELCVFFVRAPFTGLSWFIDVYYNPLTHRIHVWYIYLHLPYKSTKCRLIYHTWILWVTTWEVIPRVLFIAHLFLILWENSIPPHHPRLVSIVSALIGALGVIDSFKKNTFYKLYLKKTTSFYQSDGQTTPS